MSERRDPVERSAAGSRDLYEVATWEVRSPLDRVAALLHRGLVLFGKWLLVVAALGLLALQFLAGGLLSTVQQPKFLALVVLSVVPALGLAAYIWHVDATERQPLGALAVTFVLGVLFAMFAAVLNGLAMEPLRGLGPLGLVLLFFLVVGPVEESVKLAAVRLYAYRGDRFGAVVDGAVYGAVAGLGFATIENLLYISRSVGGAGEAALLGAAGGTAAVRALAGPGHVIYSGFAGYYLGLARFNPDQRGPIVVKGLLIAAAIHGVYNTLVGIVPAVFEAFAVIPLGTFGWFVAFVVVYDGLFGLLLYRKLDRYADALATVRSQDRTEVRPELTEFDTPTGTEANGDTGAAGTEANGDTGAAGTEADGDTGAAGTEADGDTGDRRQR